MTTRRQKRVSELIRQEIGEILEKEAADPRFYLVSVTAVEVSADLRHARVYVSTLGDAERRAEALRGLRHAARFLRRQLGARLSLRYIPELKFYLDDSLERGARIEELLRKMGEED